MTGFFDALLAALVALALNLVVLSRIRIEYPGEEGRFLATTYRWTLLLRYGLAFVLNSYAKESSFAAMFWGDSSTYDWAGYTLAQSWGEDYYIVSQYTPAWVSGYGFIYFVGVIYWAFGRNQLLVQFVNGTLGSLTVVVIYAIARLLFDEGAARWAARFMAFFPQVIFWSAAMYKDPAIMLCIAVSMYAVLRLARSFNPGMLLLFIAAVLCLMTLRFYVFYIVAFATLGTFLFGQRRGLFGNLLASIVLLGAFMGAYTFAASKEVVEQHVSYLDLDKLQQSRLDLSQSARSGFGVERDVSTRAGALSALPVGLVYLLFAPFPWMATGLRQLLTVPEMLVWYALMPAFVRGLAYGIRHRLRDCLPILVFAGTLTLAYAVFQGNVGTAYRQRTQITMFFFVFIGVGLARRQEARQSTRVRAAVAGHALPR